jgi:C_GCAxxG_C_C family probable redox protein
MERKESAAILFDGIYNCSQSVLASFADECGLEKDLAVRLATGFGAGIGKSSQVCGAVSGACMVIGLKYGSTLSDNSNFQERKENTYLLANVFLQKFKERNRSTNCRELIGYDLQDPIQYAEAKRLGLFSMLCAKYVSDAVEITEEILNSYQNETQGVR